MVNQSGSQSTVSIDGHGFSVERLFTGTNELKVLINGKPCTFYLAREKDTTYVFFNGRQYLLNDRSGYQYSVYTGTTAEDGIYYVSSPMPGKIIKIQCAEGDAVGSSDTLVVVEAMKMENALRSPLSGTVRKVHNKEGDLVDAGVPIVEIDVEGNIQ